MSSIAEQIRAKIATAQIIEAGTLLQLHADKLSPEQKQRLTTDIQRKKDEAERLVARARKAEDQGLFAESLVILEKAELLAADLPQLRQKMDELGDTAILTRAVKNKAMRREQTVSPVKRSSSPMKKGAFLVMVVAVLVVAVYMMGKFSSSPDSVTQQQSVSPEPEVPVQPQDEVVVVTEKQTVSADQVTPAPIPEPDPEPQVKQEELPATHVTQKQETAAEVSQPPASNETASVIPNDGAKIKELLPKIPDIMTVADNAAEVQDQQLAPRSPSSAEIVADTPSHSKTYIIQPGDSLSSIAHRIFCNEKERMKLYEINKDILENPNTLKPGTTIRLYSPTLPIDNHCTE